ncbi:S41 family peptidase [Geopsychrobacter electrodiphilus]|uniref:S41 family peptidase n=1 Tax=Geopsychrobacter electrodiphilus TaxID=225196 RepID=UPI001FE0AD00|nr:S41 family peptidase [Geopsychrobacter electrodiphilus]
MSCFWVQVAIAEQVDSTTAQPASNAYEDIELFTDVLAIIHRSYVEEVNIRDLIYGGIRGMLATLDPHSSFLTPELYEEMQADTHGEFGGVGIEVTLDQGILIVVSPIEGTPASRAGIKALDQIVRINGKSTQDIDLMDAVRMMRGAIGEKISLQIRRAGDEKLLNFDLMREVIQVHSVSGRTLAPGYGYARINQFQERTGQELKDLLAKIRLENKDHFKGLILDLRNNPGGLLDQAVEVSDMFLSKGLIVYTKGRDKENQLRFQASASGTEPDYPLILLINEGSASASEIVAGALHDHGRALLLGEKTFGKGSVQTIIPLSDHSGLRLTTALYYTPSGTSIQARGITPDIEVAQIELPAAPAAKGHYREKDLEHHFKAESMKSKPTENISSDSDQIHDYQLMRAFDLLKGVGYFQQIKVGQTL